MRLLSFFVCVLFCIYLPDLKAQNRASLLSNSNVHLSNNSCFAFIPEMSTFAYEYNIFSGLDKEKAARTSVYYFINNCYLTLIKELNMHTLFAYLNFGLTKEVKSVQIEPVLKYKYIMREKPSKLNNKFLKNEARFDTINLKRLNYDTAQKITSATFGLLHYYPENYLNKHIFLKLS